MARHPPGSLVTEWPSSGFLTTRQLGFEKGKRQHEVSEVPDHHFRHTLLVKASPGASLHSGGEKNSIPPTGRGGRCMRGAGRGEGGCRWPLLDIIFPDISFQIVIYSAININQNKEIENDLEGERE